MSDDKNEKDLFYLHDLSDYKVADGYSDVRDWEVKDADGRSIGKVEGLLVSKKAERVVYLDVEVDKSVIEAGHEIFSVPASKGVHEFVNEEGENHIIIPIGMADLDEENKAVYTSQINHSTFAKTKRFATPADLNRNYEMNVFSTYTPSFIVDDTNVEDDFYKQKEFGSK